MRGERGRRAVATWSAGGSVCRRWPQAALFFCVVAACAIGPSAVADQIDAEVAMARRDLGAAWANRAVAAANRDFERVASLVRDGHVGSAVWTGLPPFLRMQFGTAPLRVFEALAASAYRALLRCRFMLATPIALWSVAAAVLVDGWSGRQSHRSAQSALVRVPDWRRWSRGLLWGAAATAQWPMPLTPLVPVVLPWIYVTFGYCLMRQTGRYR